jgi:hypothetical protein
MREYRKATIIEVATITRLPDVLPETEEYADMTVKYYRLSKTMELLLRSIYHKTDRIWSHAIPV